MRRRRFDPTPVLDGLKDFQRATVDHAIDRLYTGPNPTSKFLVADEVGLGKTLVAKGVIAQTLDLLWDEVERIDIIYICSNRAIADQNITRLNVFDDDGFSFSSRMTMVARDVSHLRGNKVNFVSFTPGTSFDLKSSLGIAEERVLLWHALRRIWDRNLLNRVSTRRIFQGWLSTLDRFNELADHAKPWARRLDRDLLDRFAADLATTDLADQLAELTNQFRKTNPTDDAFTARAAFIGELRSRLATQCVAALEPDLVILDEFQRFRDLMATETEAGQLANALFDYPDNRTLLLSATPYKMFTTSGDPDDNHHQDFIDTIDFLLDDPDDFHRALRRYQDVLLDVGRLAPAEIRRTRHDLEHELTRVMVRTERLAADDSRNGMLTEQTTTINDLTAADVRSYVTMERLATAIDGGGMTEYWKSAPYFLNFTDGYKIDDRLTAALDDPERRHDVTQLTSAVGGQVDWPRWRHYDELDPVNPRLRHLIADTTGAGRWRMLWIAPSLPYYGLEGPWAEHGAAAFTKRLIFSAWAAVPKAIASVLSYDAERQMMRLRDDTPRNDPDERKKIKGLLQFRRTPTGEPGAMSAFGLLYPSIVLAEEADPLTLTTSDAHPITQADIRARIAERINDLVDTLPESPADGRVDEAWYWAAPLLLDCANDEAAWMGHKWLQLNRWLGNDHDDADDGDTSFREHVELAHQIYRGDVVLGRRPDDLVDVLVLHALGNPATLALRALWRILGEDAEEFSWDAACRIAWGFRTLFNLPENSSLIRHLHTNQPYWRSVLHYATDGCLGAVLAEYIHCLRNWLGLVTIDTWDDVNKIAEECNAAVSLKSADYVAKDHLRVSGQAEHRFRSRFALRLGNERSESDATVIRVGHVRTAFNSPFWPFVLASTSVGQEGLDFHLYCHAIVHWNLPSNPVDLEQREGRVHRFKGHAIRRNVATNHADAAWTTDRDPWDAMFNAAAEETATSSDLVPYWVYPGPASIERHVLALPLSREVGHLSRLKKSVALYRLVFGQPRQEDLLEYLAGIDNQAVLDELRIDLSPGLGDGHLTVPRRGD